MTPLDYEYLRRLLKERSGLALAADKQYLVESRLMAVARQASCDSISGLVQRLRAAAAEALTVQVVEAMMINESLFFRDKIPFDLFRETIMPALIERRAARRRIRVWCAAASTGQEPYSLAMILKAMGEKLVGWQIDIVATDIAQGVLERARAGIYSQFEIQRGLPIQMLMQHFEQVGGQWRVTEKIRRMVQFRRFNLLDDFAALGGFDVVFCRNVLIYFDHATKVDVLARVAQQLAPDGYLLMGAAETVVGLSGSFQPVADRRGLYMRDTNATPKPPLAPVTPRPVAAVKAL